MLMLMLIDVSMNSVIGNSVTMMIVSITTMGIRKEQRP
jgi:hypothetical protein